MGIFDGILGTIAGPLVSGAFGFLGQQEVNDTNEEIAANNSAFNADQARITRDFNAEQAGIQREFNAKEANTQRDWARDMSNTSYRRAVEDLKRAGLNPMLAYQQGGAATPGGASASAGAASGPSAQAAANPVIGNKNLASIAAAQSAAGVSAQLAQVEKTRAETENVRVQTESERMRQPGHMLSGEISAAQARKLKEEINKLLEDTQVSAQLKARINAEHNKIITENANLYEIRKQIEATTGKLLTETQRVKLDNILLDLDIKGEAGARSRYFEGMGPTRFFLQDAASGGGSAAALKKLFNRGGR